MSLLLLFRNRKRKERGGVRGAIYRRKSARSTELIEPPEELAPVLAAESEQVSTVKKVLKNYSKEQFENYTKQLSQNIAEYQFITKKLDNIRQSLIQAYNEEEKLRAQQEKLKDLIELKKRLKKLLEDEIYYEHIQKQISEIILAMQEEEEFFLFLMVD